MKMGEVGHLRQAPRDIKDSIGLIVSLCLDIIALKPQQNNR